METGQKIIQTNNNIDQESSNILSIQVSLNGLSFCILNTRSNTITHFKARSFDKKLDPKALLDAIEKAFNSDTYLQQSFKKVNVVYTNELFTLVPQPLFNEDHVADYLKFNSRILQTDFISHDIVDANESVIVYVPYVNINNYLYDRFGAFEYKHFSTVLLDILLQKDVASEDKKMYINVNDDHFEILVIEHKKLILFNSFEYHTKEDFIYYILFTSEQLDMNPETFHLSLFGNIVEDDTLYTIAYKYIRHVSIMEASIPYKVASDIENELSKHFVLQHTF